LPKNTESPLAWESGTVYVVANKTLGVKATKGCPFNVLSEVGRAVDKAIEDSNIAIVKFKKK
jgi:hypothetical protein